MAHSAQFLADKAAEARLKAGEKGVRPAVSRVFALYNVQAHDAKGNRTAKFSEVMRILGKRGQHVAQKKKQMEPSALSAAPSEKQGVLF